ncbi:DHS-like NAD/FAD-binding domain-containing protein [Microdochium trichocladiopsis]|uniref:DHS-like NAD/FAD-binding domain-containing protein n=1 Tax=Microdochium trichocladiopsis TaxID=1682393 RepID=A0A9P9C0U2_9PEZI|nr:DHS-like NAD/FAD-binding domain-containing protein [Microdochium trichocladiopsis]KAH7041459.1 DHS-like NAD/FAD-binding domain-containing protein [Microdochium trichocladiopsis]
MITHSVRHPVLLRATTPSLRHITALRSCRQPRRLLPSSARTMSYNTSIPAFQSLLSSLGPNSRILALCGAGLSASSGLPTFRGAGGLWRNHDPTSLATPEAFAADPALVWLFYAWRRHMALKAEPNDGHKALAKLAEVKGASGFMCLTQNVDGLSQRAGHPAAQLKPLHGNILTLKCSSPSCNYIEHQNTDDPLCPALAAAAQDYPPDQPIPLLDAATPLPEIKRADLPHCPACKASSASSSSLLRPGVVWFGESLDSDMLMGVENWIYRGPIEVMLVIGTAAAVYPAAGYVRKAKRRGAVVAVVNPDPAAAEGLGPEDFWFGGDAAEVLPALFEGLVGRIGE